MPAGGMFTWVQATDGTDTEVLFRGALDHGVAFVPGAAFSIDPQGFRHALRLSFATLEPAEIATAARRLADAWILRPATDRHA